MNITIITHMIPMTTESNASNIFYLKEFIYLKQFIA